MEKLYEPQSLSFAIHGNLSPSIKYDNIPTLETFLTKTNMSNKRGGLLFGVIMGTLVGVLFAPKKGKDLRNQLKQEVAKGGVGTETLKKNFAEMGQDMAATAEEVYNLPEVQKQVGKGKKQVTKFMEKAETHVNNAEKKVRDLGEKYLDLDDEKLQQVSKKIHKASDTVRGKIQTMRQKLMGDMGFTKKPISKKSNGKNPKSSQTSNPQKKSKSKPRTKNVKIKKHGS